MKQKLPEWAKITLITDNPVSYYSGMLPGSTSSLYTEDQIKVHLEPLAKWCKANYIQQAVQEVRANDNLVVLADGREVRYDILCLNIGSKTRATEEVPGVWEHALPTRPINDLLPKITQKEQEFLANGVIPEVGVIGHGAAGVELAFAFKARWSKKFNSDIKVTLYSSRDKVLPSDSEPIR